MEDVVRKKSQRVKIKIKEMQVSVEVELFDATSVLVRHNVVCRGQGVTRADITGIWRRYFTTLSGE